MQTASKGVCRPAPMFRTLNFFAFFVRISTLVGIPNCGEAGLVSGVADVTEKQGTDTTEHLAPDEFIEALKAMPPDDKMKLIRIDRGLRGGTGRGLGELLHEAQCATIVGERHFPRATPIIAYMILTMRSIASHDREKLQRFVSGDVEDEVAEMTADGTILPVNADATPILDPERELIEKEEEEAAARKARETVASIFALFDKEDDCQFVLMGWMEGLRGKPLREFVGVDQKQLDYLSKKIWRRVEKHYPNGYWQ